MNTTKHGTNRRRTQQIRCAIYTRKSTEEGLRAGIQLPRRPARVGARRTSRSQQHEGLDLLARPLRRRRLHRRQHGPARPAAPAGRHRGGQGRLRRGLQGGPAQSAPCSTSPGSWRCSSSTASRFVSVTQQFNTATSMGRLMLNVLLSFAQFEREIICGADAGQDRRHPPQGKVVGRHAAARLRRRPARLEAGGQRGRGRAGAGHLRAVPGAPGRCCRWSRNWSGAAGPTSAGRRARAHERGGKPFTKTSLHQLLTNVALRRQGALQGRGPRRRTAGHRRRRHLAAGAGACSDATAAAAGARCGTNSAPAQGPAALRSLRLRRCRRRTPPRRRQELSLLRLQPGPEARLARLPVEVDSGRPRSNGS